MSASGHVILGVVMLALATSCRQRTVAPAQAVPPNGPIVLGLNGAFRPGLTNGQVLTGRVRFRIEPVVKNRGHWVVLLIDDKLIDTDATFRARATNVVILEIDTSKFPPGPHVLTLGGEVDASRDMLDWVAGKTDETEPLTQRTWKVTFGTPQ